MKKLGKVGIEFSSSRKDKSFGIGIRFELMNESKFIIIDLLLTRLWIWW